MSRRNIDERKCDQCEKVVTQSEKMFGGSPFNSWLQVIRTDGTTVLPRKDNGPWDFCCIDCLIKFFTLIGVRTKE